jgi:predicted ATP-binding protein involved in virulence
LRSPLAQLPCKIMRVKELKLHNFRGIKDLHLVFNTEHNVIVLAGINGIGKSSILDCINLLIKDYVMIRDLYYLIEEDNLIYFSPGPISKAAPDHNEILSISDIQNGKDCTNNKILFDSNGLSVEWELDKSNNHEYESWNKRHEESTRKIISSVKLNLMNHYFYYLSDRQVLDTEDLISSNHSYMLPSAYIHEKPGLEAESGKIISFKDFSKWFKDTEDLENEQRLSSNNEYRHPQLEAVRHSVYSLLGKDYTTLTFKRAINKMTIKKSNREIAIELLSDGEKNLLAMVSHLARKLAEDNEYIDNPLDAPALVLIDEIELHLHPAWQRMIIPRLTQTFPNCQFIVTTHSPQVLSHVDPECIHILAYDGDNVIVKRPDSSYGLDSNRILEDILGVSKRPQEIQERMSELFRTINNNDLEGAKEIVKELGDRIGIDEPELVKAEATIKRREIIGR